MLGMAFMEWVLNVTSYKCNAVVVRLKRLCKSEVHAGKRPSVNRWDSMTLPPSHHRSVVNFDLSTADRLLGLLRSSLHSDIARIMYCLGDLVSFHDRNPVDPTKRTSCQLTEASTHNSISGIDIYTYVPYLPSSLAKAPQTKYTCTKHPSNSCARSPKANRSRKIWYHG
jgi:hypothetical protein